MSEQFNKIEELMKKKFQKIIEPQKDDYVIVLKEELIDAETSTKNYELGIGKVMKFPNKVSVNGKIFRNEELDEIKEGSTSINLKEAMKQDDRHKIIIVKVPKLFYRAVDEATWANSFKTLGDIIRVIEDFEA